MAGFEKMAPVLVSMKPNHIGSKYAFQDFRPRRQRREEILSGKRRVKKESQPDIELLFLCLLPKHLW